MTDTGAETRRGRLPKWVTALPLVLAALCLLAILPLLLYAPTVAGVSFVSGKAIATGALVAYPTLLLTLIIFGVSANQRGRLAKVPFRLAFWLLVAAFVCAIAVATLLMASP